MPKTSSSFSSGHTLKSRIASLSISVFALFAFGFLASLVAPQQAYAESCYLSWNGGHYNYDHDGDGAADMDDPYFTVYINGQTLGAMCNDSFGCTPADGWYNCSLYVISDTADYTIYGGTVYTSGAIHPGAYWYGAGYTQPIVFSGYRVEKPRGAVELTKTASENKVLGISRGKIVPNATYRFEHDGSSFTATTDANGKLYRGELSVGTWYAYEQSVPWPYVVSNTPVAIQLERDKTTKVSVTDQTTGLLKIAKSKLPPNTTYSTKATTITSGKTATAQLSAKVTGNRNIAYTVRIKGASGAGNFTVTVPNKITLSNNLSDTTNASVSGRTITFRNNTADRTITFSGTITQGWSASEAAAVLGTLNCPAGTGEASAHLSTNSLAGAQYTLYNDSSCLDDFAVVTTDANGIAKYGYTSPQILVPGRTYYLKETRAPSGYGLDTKIYSFTAVSGAETLVNTGDSFTSIKVEKRSRYASYTDGNTNYSLAGAKYGVYDRDPSMVTGLTPIYTITTDSTGCAYKDGLAPGIYFVKEITASKGFQVDPVVYSLDLNDNCMAVAQSTEDIPVTITIKKASASPVPDVAAYSLAGATFGIYKTSADATANTNAVAQVTSDASGNCPKTTLPMRDYYVKELVAPSGYELNSTVFQIKATDFAKNINQKLTVSDTPKKIRITPTKTADADTLEQELFSSLANAKISIYATYDDARNRTNPIQTVTSAANGTCPSFYPLEPREYYYIREDEAPINYLLNDSILTTHITNSLTVSEEVHDDGQPVDIIVKKTKADPELPAQYNIAGATFGIYKTEDDARNRENAVATVTCDANGNCPTVTGLKPREYWVSEIAAPNGFWLNDDPQKISFTQTTQFSATATMPEEAKYGFVKASKRSSSSYATPDTNSSLFSYANAKFAVYATYNEALVATNENPGNPLTTMITPASGDVTSTTPLIPGTYYMKELVAPTGYTLSNAVYTVQAVLDPNRTSTRSTMIPRASANTLMSGLPTLIDPDVNPIAAGISATPTSMTEKEEPGEIEHVILEAGTDTSDMEVIYEDDNVSIVEHEIGDELTGDAAVAETVSTQVAFNVNEDAVGSDNENGEDKESKPLLAGNPTKLEGADTLDVPDRKTIAVIDTGSDGVYTDMEVSLVDDDPADYNGHGTDMARIIREGAPDAYILSIKAFGADGRASADAVYLGIRYAIDAGADVINMSFAAYAPNGVPAIEAICLEARNKGIAVVGAAGNYASSASEYCPANTAGVAAVGAWERKDTPQPFSNFGEAVEVWQYASSTSEACALTAIEAAADPATFIAQYVPDAAGAVSDQGDDPVFEVQKTETYSTVGWNSLFSVPYQGTYTLDVRGASGGHERGAWGGQSTGTISLNRGDYLNIGIGGVGGRPSGTTGGAGGTNGGGKGGNGTGGYGGGGGGGGATHIAKANTKQSLANYSGNKTAVVIIAGGGGGGAWISYGGNGGGGNAAGGNSVSANSGYYTSNVTAYGGPANSTTRWATGANGPNGHSEGSEGSGGGGGGRSGGGTAANNVYAYQGTPGGGGGSGYIGGVTNGNGSSGTWGNGNNWNGYATITYGTTQTIAYNKNSSTATGSMSNQTFNLGSSTTQKLTANAFTNKHTITYNYNGNGQTNTTATATHAFNGWNKKSDGTGTSYTNQQSFTSTSTPPGGYVIGNTTTLYAQWKAATVTLPNPTRTGYKLNGWYTAATGGTKVGNGGATYTATKDITLYAQWSQDNYYVKFDANGGTGTMANETFQRDIAKALTSNAFTKANCTFVGWSRTKPATNVRVPHKDYNNGQSVTNIAASGETITLYAVWQSTITAPNDATVVKNDPITTSIKIQKRPGSVPDGADLSSGKYSLAGAKFGIYDSQAAANAATPANPGTPKATLTTAADGTTPTWTGAVVGTSYWIKEIQAPTGGGYLLNTATFATGAIVDQQVKVVTVTDDISETPGTLTINKQIADAPVTLNTSSGSWTPQNAQFGVFKTEAEARQVDGIPYKVLTTDASGITSIQLAPGTYYVKEMKAPAGCNLNQTVYTATVPNGGSTSVDVSNNPQYVSLSINKKNASPESVSGLESSYSLAGAVFEIYESQANASTRTNPVATATTDASGNATITGLFPAVYYLREKTAPANFAINETIFTVANSTVEQTFEIVEEPQVAHISLTKIADIDLAGYPELTLAGAVFGIYSDAQCSTEVQRITTDASGQATSTALIPGIYYVKEISAPNGFKINEQVKTADVSTVFDASVSFEEETKLGRISLSKATNHSEWIDSLAGAVFGIYSDVQCTNMVDSIVTDNTGSGTSSNLVWNTYYVKEIQPLTNHAGDGTVYTVVLNGPNATVNSGTAILNKTTRIGLHKSAAPGAPRNYPLTGAVYGIYEDETCSPGSEAYTLALDADGNASVYPIEPGTYYVKEIQAPYGYELDTVVHSVTVTGDADATIMLTDTTSLLASNEPPLLRITKESSETGAITQGSIISYAGAEFTINYYPIELEDKSEAASLVPERTWVIRTDNNGIAVFDEDHLVSGEFYMSGDDICLPDGTIIISETKAPTGMTASNETWMYVVSEDGLRDELGNYENTVSFTVYDTPIRANLAFDKKDDHGNSMGNMPFLISLLDGNDAVIEQHLVFTDANGHFDSASATSSTPVNNNDSLISTSGGKTTVPNPDNATTSSRLWFNGTQLTTAAPDNRGSLVYGTYRIEELPCPTNANYILAPPVTVTVTSEGTSVSAGTFVNRESRITATSATDNATGTHHGSSVGSVITDVVTYENFDTNLTYTITGIVYDATTGDPIYKKGTQIQLDPITGETVLDPVTGEPVYIEGTTLYLPTIIEFHPETANGTFTMTYDMSEYDIEGRDVSIKTTATVGMDQKSEHNANLADAGESLDYPKIRTSAIDGTTNDHVGNASSTITIKDTVTYTNLVPNATYTVTGTLHQAEGSPTADAGVITDASNNPVTASTTFTASSSGNGTALVTFSFTPASSPGNVVVFENLFDADNVLVAQHADITDRGQTVTYPDIATTALDVATGTHQGRFVDGKASITDTVAYEDLTPGTEYRLEATLMPVEGAALSATPITASTTFTPTNASGTATVTFTDIAQTILAGRATVVFEKLYRGTDLIAAHEARNDTDQQVCYPAISTTALDAATEQHLGLLSTSGESLIDHVAYSGLVPGETYVMKGRVMDKASGNAIMNGSQPVTVEKTFVAEDYSGTVALQFNLPASSNAFTAVVYEKLYMADGTTELASHEEINDEAQSVHYPKIGTTANDADTHDHEGANDGTITINDVVSYTNLIGGQSYTINGTLMDKSNGQVLTDDQGHEITATTTFTAAASGNGTATVTFTFNKSATENKTVVVYETLYSASAKIAEHADLTDEEQSVFFPKIRTLAKDDQTALAVSSINASGKIKIIDTVSYENLIVGHEYILNGKLMNAETGNVLKNTSNVEVTGSTTFTPTAKNGTVDVVFEFDASLADGVKLVAFEYLVRNDYTIDTHTDLEDEDQSIYCPHISTNAIDKTTSLKVGYANGTITMTDTVSYDHLLPGVQYTLEATLYSKASSSVLVNGTTPVKGTATFTPTATSGTCQVEITFPATLIANGDTLVAYEKLIYNGKTVTTHENPDDVAQTVYYPKIGTTATDAVTHIHEGTTVNDTTVIEDVIAYTNLLPGVEYDVSATVMNKTTGATIPSTMAEGSKKFTPTAASGTFTVMISVASSELVGKTAVIYEKLSVNDHDIAVHEDINDVAQTISYPKISTTATDAITTFHEGLAKGTISITDIVACENLVVGTQYKLSGKLYDKTLGSYVMNGTSPVTATATFTATATEQSVSMTFSCPAALVAGHDIVVFERLSTNNNDIAKHEDAEDENQTVSYPAISTCLLGVADMPQGAHEVPANRHVTFTDTITYTNLVPNTQYTIKSVLVFKDSGEPFVDAAGRTIEKEETFTPTTADGTYDITFPEIDAYRFEGTETVAYEYIYKDSKLVGEHEDLTDSEQTIKFIDATDRVDLPYSGAFSKILIQLAGIAFIAVGIVAAVRRYRKHAKSSK